MDYRKRLVIDSEVRSGKPCIKGTRITVYDVLSYFASDMSEAQILDEHPQLTHEDLLACFAFAADAQAMVTLSR